MTLNTPKTKALALFASISLTVLLTYTIVTSFQNLSSTPLETFFNLIVQNKQYLLLNGFKILAFAIPFVAISFGIYDLYINIKHYLFKDIPGLKELSFSWIFGYSIFMIAVVTAFVFSSIDLFSIPSLP